MNRKKTVLIEWIILLLVVAALAGLCIGIITKLTGSKSDRKQTEAAGEPGSEGQMQASSEDTQQTAPDMEAENEIMPTPTPDPVKTYTLSFAGDCTIGSLIEWQGGEPGDFQSVVGTNYAYPLSGVKHIFEADDLTMVNLEGTFTTAYDAVDKPYRFRADPAYVQVLTEGSVEAVSASNNHADDFFDAGVSDTLSTVTGAGLQYARAGSPMIREMEGGLKIGVVAYNTVENWEGEDVWRSAVLTDIEKCKAENCDLIIGFMHWGTVEYLTEPEYWEVEFAHDMVEWGCDMIVGGHAHILQRMEYYNNVPIFFSMGNFCYGGHLNPPDKDSVIVQADFTYNSLTDEVSRSGLRVIPCLVSSRTDANDYCPTPCQEGSEDYQRIIERLEWTS